MKKLLCLCLILPLFVSAQSHSNKIYFEFEDTEGTNTFSFSSTNNLLLGCLIKISRAIVNPIIPEPAMIKS